MKLIHTTVPYRNKPKLDMSGVDLSYVIIHIISVFVINKCTAVI